MNWPRLVVLALWAAASVPAHAHAFLERAQPRVGATVSAPPAQLTLNFTEQIEAAFSTVKVIDGKGQRMDKGDMHVQGTQMQVSLALSGPGDYTVTWRVVSKDTHVTEGDFVFHVRP